MDWRSLPQAPSGAFSPRYVYLCRFAKVAKVGVTIKPAQRIKALACEHGAPSDVIVELVGYFEAGRREAAIARAFGWPTKAPGRKSEFFAPEHFDAAAVMIRQETPEFRQSWLKSEERRACLEARYLVDYPHLQPRKAA